MPKPPLKPTLTWMGSELQERLTGESMFTMESCTYINLLIVVGFKPVADREIAWLKQQQVVQAFHPTKFRGILNLATTDTQDLWDYTDKLSVWVPEYILSHPQECEGLSAIPCDVQSPLDRLF